MLSASLLTAGIMQQHKIYLAPDTKTENQKLLFTSVQLFARLTHLKWGYWWKKTIIFYIKRGNLHQYLYYRQWFPALSCQQWYPALSDHTERTEQDHKPSLWISLTGSCLASLWSLCSGCISESKTCTDHLSAAVLFMGKEKAHEFTCPNFHLLPITFCAI